MKTSMIILSILSLLYVTSLSFGQSNGGFPYYSNCIKTFNASGYTGVFDARSNPSEYYLYLIAATIRDDGESTSNVYSPTADIGLHIYGGEHYERKLYKSVRLFGPYYEGADEDGTYKYEWMSYCTIYYNYFALMPLGDYNYSNIRLKAEEGDDAGSKDDIVFDAYINLEQIKEGKNMVTGHCDIPGKCATFLFAIQSYQSNPNCGYFWDYIQNVPALPKTMKMNDYNPIKWGTQAGMGIYWFVDKVVFDRLIRTGGLGIWPHKWVVIKYSDGYCIFNRVRAKRTMQDIINTATGKGGDCDWSPWPEGSRHVCLDNYTNAAQVVKNHGRIIDIVWIDHPTSNCGY